MYFQADVSLPVSLDPADFEELPFLTHKAGYYNEARILDPGTFQTVTTLPNIPGAVNNFLAGRTYPMEGTSVLLPQHAPYTDPITILVCGGSTPGAAVALDNCVSIQPESANPTWVIERMVRAFLFTRGY
jgi:hypothetical protein